MKLISIQLEYLVFVIAIVATLSARSAVRDSSVVESRAKEEVTSTSSQHQLEIGLLFQRSYRFYWENGITATYRSSSIFDRRLSLGLNVLSSRLGTASGTNAIKQDQVSLFGQFDFLPKKVVRPFVQASVGYIKARYDQDLFLDLTDQSILSAINFGITGTIKDKFLLKGSIGYNLIGGDGQSGLATVYPLIFQLSAQYVLKK